MATKVPGARRPAPWQAVVGRSGARWREFCMRRRDFPSLLWNWLLSWYNGFGLLSLGNNPSELWKYKH